MNPPDISSTDEDLQQIVKVIADLDQLVGLMLKRVPLTKPWQRQLAEGLSKAEREVQVLRIMISLERSAADLMIATADLNQTCRSIDAALRASRADITTRQAVRLLVGMSDSIVQAISSLAAARVGHGHGRDHRDRASGGAADPAPVLRDASESTSER